MLPSDDHEQAAGDNTTTNNDEDWMEFLMSAENNSEWGHESGHLIESSKKEYLELLGVSDENGTNRGTCDNATETLFDDDLIDDIERIMNDFEQPKRRPFFRRASYSDADYNQKNESQPKKRRSFFRRQSYSDVEEVKKQQPPKRQRNSWLGSMRKRCSFANRERKYCTSQDVTVSNTELSSTFNSSDDSSVASAATASEEPKDDENAEPLQEGQPEDATSNQASLLFLSYGHWLETLNCLPGRYIESSAEGREGSKNDESSDKGENVKKDSALSVPSQYLWQGYLINFDEWCSNWWKTDDGILQHPIQFATWARDTSGSTLETICSTFKTATEKTIVDFAASIQD